VDLCPTPPGKDSTQQKFETAFSIRQADLARIPGKGLFGYYNTALPQQGKQGPILNSNGPTVFTMWDTDMDKDKGKAILWNIMMWTDKKENDPSSPVAKVMNPEHKPASYDVNRTGEARWKSMHELGHNDPKLPTGMFNKDSDRVYRNSKLVM